MDTATLTQSLTILTAMITPAVLILATGSLLLTTSQRLSRSIDRSRRLSDALDDSNSGKHGLTKEKTRLLYRQLLKTTQRAVLLQRSMSMLYIALVVFVATSLVIGLFEVLDPGYGWMPLAIGMIGAVILFAAGISLLFETTIALGAVKEEMQYLRRNGRIISEK